MTRAIAHTIILSRRMMLFAGVSIGTCGRGVAWQQRQIGRRASEPMALNKVFVSVSMLPFYPAPRRTLIAWILKLRFKIKTHQYRHFRTHRTDSMSPDDKEKIPHTGKQWGNNFDRVCSSQSDGKMCVHACIRPCRINILYGYTGSCHPAAGIA